MSLDNSVIAKKVFEYLNEVRINPKKALEDLMQVKQFYKDKFYCNPSLPVIIETKEGLAAVDDAIAFLQKQAPISKLTWEDSLLKTSVPLLNHFEKQGSLSHGQGDSAFGKRIGEQNKSNARLAENIGLGHNDPKEIVLHMIIDDGLNSRKNRINLFDLTFGKVGVAFGKHKEHRHACVISFREENMKDLGSMEKYWIPKNQWPIDATSVEKHFEVIDEDSKRVVVAKFEFTHANGTKSVQTKEFKQ